MNNKKDDPINKSKEFLIRVVFILTAFISTNNSLDAQEMLFEKLNRGLVAIQSDEGIFLSWRILATEHDSIEFYIYKNDTLINETPITGKSNYIDTEGSPDDFYYVKDTVRKSSGITSGKSDAVAVWSEGYQAGSSTGYKEIPLQKPADDYKPDDIEVADIDGDGEYEYIVKMQATKRDNSQYGMTDPTYIQAYELNGTLLWQIYLGKNIRSGSHYTPFIVYDFDGDGKAEMGMKTAPGTIDGTGNYLSDGPAADDNDDTLYVDNSGLILTGNEYLTLFDGETGKELSTVDYVPERGDVNDWGDNYGNRSERYLACAAYFDTIPSLVMCRGYYTRSVLAAWDYKDGELVQRWVFDTDSSTKVGKDGNTYDLYAGQGAHSLSVGDIDDDGKDEIIYGAMAVDDDGTGLWTTGNNHGDATHLGDFMPDHDGMEYFMVCESAYDSNKVTTGKVPYCWFADAASGDIIWEIESSKSQDVGRGFCDDVTTDNKGPEFFVSNSVGLLDQDGNSVSYSSEFPAQNFGSWWDGDITREVLSGTAIKKWSLTEKYSILEPDDCEYNNSTKAIPAFSGDIFGDWREEVIWRTEDNKHLRIYTTTDTTEYGLYTLLQDPQYRMAVAWQNVGYNQPPHPSFYIGDGFDTLSVPSPNIKMIDPDVKPSIEIITPSVGTEVEKARTVNVSYHLTGISDTTTLYLNNGSTVLDTMKGGPYFTSFKGSDTLSSGNYEIYAWAYDANGNLVISDTISFLVDYGYPHISFISPDDEDHCNSSDSVTFMAYAYDSDGSVDSVSFYFNDILAGITSTSISDTFTIKVKNPGYGIYDLKAIAIDNDLKRTATDTNYGNTKIADSVTINIGTSLIIQEDTIAFCGYLTSGWSETTNSGYTGSAYANAANAEGGGVSFAFKIAEAGDYIFYWRYASENDRPALLYVNDTVIGDTLAFESTDESWSTWYFQASEIITLDTGVYTLDVEATTSYGIPNIDYMEILAIEETAAEVYDCDSLNAEEEEEEEEEETNNIAATSAADNIAVFPIPASGSLNIETSGDELINTVTVYDLTGKQVIYDTYSANDVTLDISTLKAGLYMLKLNTSADVYMKKLLIK